MIAPGSPWVRHFSLLLLGPTLSDQPRCPSHLESCRSHSHSLPRLLLHRCFHWLLQVFERGPLTRNLGERGTHPQSIGRDTKQQRLPTCLPYAVERGPETAKCRADRDSGVQQLEVRRAQSPAHGRMDHVSAQRITARVERKGEGPREGPVMHVLTHLLQKILVQVDLILPAAPSSKLVVNTATLT